MAELTTLARPYAKAAFQSALDDSALDNWSAMLTTAAAYHLSSQSSGC